MDGLGSADGESAALIEECAARSLALLRANLTPRGIAAAAPSRRADARGYGYVFARDAAVCALAMLRSGDPVLVDGAHASLATLAAHQAENGQIPKYVDPVTDAADFWYLGCIDATLWWLIAVALGERWAPQSTIAARFARQVERALDWLACQEHQRIWLLQQNEASDWADIMPRTGFVLYTNALWHYVKSLYGLSHADETRRHFDFLFNPFGRQIHEYRRLRLLAHYVRNRARNRELYLSYVNFASWGEEGDVFGNVLATLFGLAGDGRAHLILQSIRDAQAGAAHPVRVTCEVIGRDDPRWRDYMGRHRQNLEHQYHNGGIWPMVGGFWVMALARAGEGGLARRELARLAAANAAGGWQFNEWFHGRTGAACGMTGQSWNAAAFLLARDSLASRIFD